MHDYRGVDYGPGDELIDRPEQREGERLVRRSTWLIALVFLVGVPSAYLLRASSNPSYMAEGNIWIESTSRTDVQDLDRAAAEEMRRSNAWIELLRSFQVLEPVVVDQKLYIQAPEEHAEAFASFRVADQFVPGAFELRVGNAGERFSLHTNDGDLVQQGRLGEPIGENVGFAWTPDVGLLAPNSTVVFSVLSVRDAAHELSRRLSAVMDRDGNFLALRLEGSDRQKTADVLNALMERYVQFAAELKNGRLRETVEVLEDQLRTVERQLAQAERDLEEFRSSTISLVVDPPVTGEAERLEADPRTIEEERLRRRVRTTENLYNEIRNRFETAKRAEASSIPDLRVLDRAPRAVRQRR